jgi:hypothetical protein
MKTYHLVIAKLRDFWIDRLWVDKVIVAVILAAHAALLFLFPVFDVFGNTLPADRRGVYASTAVVVSLLASFSGVAIGQLSSAKGSRADALRTQGADVLAKNWRSIFRAGMLSAMLAIAALLLDPSVVSASIAPVVVRWLFEAGLLYAVVKFVRLSSLFYEVLTLAAKSAQDEEEVVHEALVPNENWHRAANF